MTYCYVYLICNELSVHLLIIFVASKEQVHMIFNRFINYLLIILIYFKRVLDISNCAWYVLQNIIRI